MAIKNRKHKAALVFDELPHGFDSLERSRFYGSEGKKHYLCKHLAAKIINDAGRDVCIEVDIGQGTVDVLDMADSTEHARAIELETAYSPQVVEEKREAYVESSELVGDVHVIPIGDAPNDLDALEDYLREYIPAV